MLARAALATSALCALLLRTLAPVEAASPTVQVDPRIVKLIKTACGDEHVVVKPTPAPSGAQHVPAMLLLLAQAESTPTPVASASASPAPSGAPPTAAPTPTASPLPKAPPAAAAGPARDRSRLSRRPEWNAACDSGGWWLGEAEAAADRPAPNGSDTRADARTVPDGDRRRPHSRLE